MRRSFKDLATRCTPTLDDGPETVWPSDPELEKLSAMIDGLFIYASTIMKFIGDSGNPRHNLRVFFANHAGATQGDELDQLYYRMVSSPKAKDSFELTCIIVHLHAELSVRDLRCILPDSMDLALGPFSSVISVPQNMDGKFHAYHSSFREFLINSSRSRDYYVNASDCHRKIAIFCLRFLIKSLRRDICDIRNPSRFNNEVEDLDTRCRENISTALQYCCIYWANHVSLARMDGEILDGEILSELTGEIVPQLAGNPEPPQ